MKSKMHSFLIFFLILNCKILLSNYLTKKDTIEISLNFAGKYSDTFCFNETKTLHAVFNASLKYDKILWYKNDTLILNASGTKIKTKERGVYFFCLYLNDTIIKKSKPKILFAPQKAIIKTGDNIKHVCQSEPLNIRSYPSRQKEYRWSFNSKNISNIVNLEVCQWGIYHTKVVMQNGCIDRDSIEIFPQGIWTNFRLKNQNPKKNDTIKLSIHLKNYNAITSYHVPIEIEIPNDFEIIKMPNIVLQNKINNTYFFKIDSINSYKNKDKYELEIPFLFHNKNECQKIMKIKIKDSFCYYPITDSIIFNKDTISKIFIQRDETKLCSHTAAYLQSNFRSNSKKISFHWYKDSIPLLNKNSAFHTTLDEGNHKLKMTSNSCPFFSNNLPVKIYNPLYSVTEVNDNYCLGNFNGSIKINISGGRPPYSYLWNTKAKENEIKNIPAGQYQVYIKDQNNCEITKNIEVKNKIRPSLKSKIIATNNESQTYSIQFELDSNNQKPFLIQEVSKNIYFQTSEVFNIPKSYNQFKAIDYEGCESNIITISH